MARPYKDYRADRARYGEQPRALRACRYNVRRAPVALATVVVGTDADSLKVIVDSSATLPTTPDGSDVAVVVNFGELGSPPVAGGADVEHVYAAAGDYVVTVIATATNGQVSSKVATVTVTDPV